MWIRPSISTKGSQYDAMKSLLLKTFSPSQWVHMVQILATLDLGNLQPSQLADYFLRTLSDMDPMVIIWGMFQEEN